MSHLVGLAFSTQEFQRVPTAADFGDGADVVSARYVCLRGDCGVRGRGAIIGVIFGQLDGRDLRKNASIEYIVTRSGLMLIHLCATEIAGLAGGWATATSST